MNRTAVTSRATTGIVAAVAGFASYVHITKVAHQAGEHGSVAAVLPLSIDGLILVGTLAMLEDKRDGRRPRLSARIAVGFGVVATLAANIASAQPTTTARLVAAVPPIAFLIAVEVLSRRGRRILSDPVPEPPGEAAEEPMADPWVYSTPVAPEPVREPVQRKRVTARSLTAADRVTAAHDKEPAATHERIAKLAEVSVSTVKRYRPTGSPSAEQAAETSINGAHVEMAGVTR